MSSTSWHSRPLASFDIESTGLDTGTDRIVTAALWRIDPANGRKEAATWLINPGVDIPQAATDIHGVTTAHAEQHGRPAAEALAEIATALGKVGADGLPLVVYNAPYDLTLLEQELLRHRIDAQVVRQLCVVDPLVLDKHTDPYRRGGRTLLDVCGHHGIALDRDQAHGAAADALAAGRLAWKLGSTRADLAQMSVADLHTAQVRWKADQAASFQAYLRRSRDPEAVIDGSWPITGE